MLCHISVYTKTAEIRW